MKTKASVPPKGMSVDEGPKEPLLRKHPDCTNPNCKEDWVGVCTFCRWHNAKALEDAARALFVLHRKKGCRACPECCDLEKLLAVSKGN